VPDPESAMPTLAYGNLADRPSGSFTATVFLIKIGARHPRPLLQDNHRTGSFTFKAKSFAWRCWAQGIVPVCR